MDRPIVQLVITRTPVGHFKISKMSEKETEVVNIWSDEVLAMHDLAYMLPLLAPISDVK